VKPSVVVVGAGIIGCAIARELSSRGARCTVVDDRGVAGGATQASAGMLAPYVEAHDPGPLLDLAVRSLHLYPQWIAAIRRESRVDVEFASIGTLEVATTPERASELQAASREHGRWLRPEELRRDCPGVRSSLGGRLVAEHGYVIPSQLAGALAHSAEQFGATFHAGRVERITRHQHGLGVETTTGHLDADVVVIASGAWTGGIQGIRTPAIRPVRGQIVQLAWRAPTLTSIVWGPHCYVVPRLDRTILVGATVEDAGYDERTTTQGIRDLLDAVCDLLPEARDASFVGARVGLRPAAPDDLPVIGGLPAEPGILYATGHYRNGVLLAPVTAQLIADLAIDGRRDPCLESFRVDRFIRAIDPFTRVISCRRGRPSR
jgi:glycine oxidase